MHLALFAFMQVVQSVGDRSLNSIDEKFIVAGGFLKKFMKEPGKLECLKAFADSLDIVEWILKETKGTCMYIICAVSYATDGDSALHIYSMVHIN